MRVTIIKDGGLVSVDGYPIRGLDMTGLQDDFHALQWYHTSGDIEFVDAETGRHRNESITSLTPFQGCINAWEHAKHAIDNPPPPPPETLPEARDRRLADLSDLRWQKETGGVAFNGKTIATDVTSQTKITGAVVGMQIDPTASINWKTADGSFVTLNAAQVIALGTAVRDHIQACFNREQTLRVAIEGASTLTALAAIDITTGWP